MTPFKFTGLTPRDLSTGRPVATGDVVELPNTLHPHDAALVSSGELIPVERQKKKNTTAPEPAHDPEEKS